LHFRGDVPCSPHKQHGVHCDGCTYYRQRTGRILIIKLGATGDVIRTSVLLQPLRDRYPDHEIWWLTLTPEVVPSSVHRRLKFTPENLLLIYAVQFNVVINLDKDPHACALMAGVQAQERYGFTLADGVPAPANALAEHKFVTGLFDDASQANTLSYPQEVLELCGFEWNGQEYELDPPGPSPLTIPPASLVVGLNTGCGDRWVSREWPLEYWVRLIGLLKGAGAGVVLLGGPSEHERNVLLRERTGALYEGTYPLMEFAAMINACDVVVSAVTMAMHMAIALR
jgi:heptosyltransferase-2